MTRRLRARLALGLLALLLAGGAALLALSRREAASPGEMARLRATRDRLLDSVERAWAAERPVAAIERLGGNVGLAVSNRFLAELAEQVVPAYLSGVRLDLRGIEARDEGELHADTFLGDMKLGSWKVRLVLREARGLLRAGTPELSFKDGEVKVRQPFRLVQGHMRGRLVFRWDSSGLTNVVCRDFAKTIEVEGSARPRRYAASGAFAVTAKDGELSLLPEFASPRFRLLPDASDETWQRARSALESEDGLLHCGLAMDPAEVLERLRELVERGFEITVPDRLFRAVRWPAHVSQELRVDGRSLRLSLRSPRVEVGPRFLLYGAALSVDGPAQATRERGSAAGP